MAGIPMPTEPRKWAAGFDADELTFRYAQKIFAPPCEIEIVELTLAPDRRVHAVAADDLDRAESLSDARDRAWRLLMVLSALLFTRDPTRPAVYVKEIYERRQDGSWLEHPWTVTPQAGYTRSKIFNRFYPEKSIEADPSERKWLAILDSENVIDALHALSGEPDWFDLWKAHEAVKRYRRDRHKDWPGEHDPAMDRFEKTATLHRHSRVNEHYRRAKKYFEQERVKPMTLGEAADAVARSVRDWLEGERAALVRRRGRNLRGRR
jgi:hypothetical protein